MDPAMSSSTAPPSTPRSLTAVVRYAVLAVLLPAAWLVPAATAGSTAAGSTTAPVGQIAEAPIGPGLASGTYRITLLTGDVVGLHVTADRRQAAWVEEAIDPQRPPHIYESDGQVRVVPAEAEPYLASGALDEDLFNVTLLARDGYDD